MKKRIITIAITVICAAGLAIGITSFTQGAGDGSSQGTGALASLANSYIKQTQRIIDNSNLSDEVAAGGVEGDARAAKIDEVTKYHIVQITDTLGGNETKLYSYIQSDAFRTNIIGSQMKSGKFDLVTYTSDGTQKLDNSGAQSSSSAAEFASAIKGADLIYISVNDSYEGRSLPETVKSAFAAYEGENKPVIFDKGITGDKSTNTDIDDQSYKHTTKIYDFASQISSQAGTINDYGTSSIKGSGDWSEFLNMQSGTTYVDFDNNGEIETDPDDPNTVKIPWNYYDQINVLEVVPSSDTQQPTAFYNEEIKTELSSDGTPVSKFGMALSNTERNQDLSKGYRCMTVKELNDAVASDANALSRYQIIYFSHESSTPFYEFSSTNGSEKDLTDASVAALRSFVKTKSEDVAKAENKTIDDSEKGQYVNRLIFDEKNLSVYKSQYAPEGSSSTSGASGSSGNSTIYSNNIFELYDTYASMKNSEIVENGFFGSIKAAGEKRITDLINRSTYRTWNANGNGSTFKVLEIEPYYNVPVSHQDWLQNKGNELTDYLADGSNFENRYVSTTQDNIEKPYYEFVMTQARIAAATGLDPNQISVTCMSANQIGSTSVNILEDYDLVYIGDMHKNVKKKTDWESYNDSKQVFSPKLSSRIELDNNWFQNNKSSDDLYNAFVYPGYSHTGEFVISSDKNFTSIFAVGTNMNQVTRTNGSDITSKVAAQLYEYARTGMPLIIGADVVNSDYKIGGASVNAKLTPSDSVHLKYSSGNTRVDHKGYVLDVYDSTKVSTEEKVSSEQVTNVTEGSTVELSNTRYTVEKIDRDETVVNPWYTKLNSITLHLRSLSDNSDLEKKYGQWDYVNVVRQQRTVDQTTTSTDQARKESDIDPSSYMYQLMYMIAEDPDSGIYHDSHPNIMVGFGTGSGMTAFDPDNAQLLNNHYNKGMTGDDDDPVEDGTDKLVSNIGDNAEFPVFNKKASKELRQFLNQNVKVRPAINLVSAPVDYDSDRDMDVKTRKTNSKEPTFTFSITGEPGTYTVDLFYDLNGDGNFTNAKVDGRIKGTTYDTERVMDSMSYTIPASQTGDIITINKDTAGVDPKTFVVDKDFVGVLPYKIVVTDSTGKVTSVTGYPKYYAKNNKSKLRILEIIPGKADGNVGAINSDISTLCVKEPTLGNGRNIRNHDGECEFGLNSADDRTKNLASALTSGDAEYDIHLTLMTTRIMDELAKRWLTNYASNWDMNKSKLDDPDRKAFETKFLGKYFKNGKLTPEFENMIKSDVREVYDFGDKFGLTDNILANWLYSGDETVKTYIDAATGKKLEYDLGGYNMIVIGFSQQMGGKDGSIIADGDICNLTAKCISAYIRKSGSVLMGNDTTSYRPMTAGDVGWSKNINEYLRADFGMDRFKFNPEYGEDTSINNDDQAGSNARSSFTVNYYTYKPYVNGYDGPGEFLTLNSYDGTYYGWKDNQYAVYGAGATDAFTYAVGDGKSTVFSTNGVQVGVNRTRQNPGPTSRAVRSNTGLLTKYPFTLGAFPSISRTAAQYFALDTEDDYLNVWYTLASDGNQDNSLYAADPYNGRSHYYLYTYKSVTYTGAGYSDFNSTSGNEDERRLIINAIINKANLSKSGLSVEFSKYASNGEDDKSFEKVDEDKAGTFADGSPYSILSINDADKDYVNFNIKYSDVPERTLKSVRLFIDNNHNGKKDGDDADIQGDYDLFKDMENEVSFHIRGSKLDDAVTKAAQKGTFYICLSVSDDKQTEYQILKVKVNKKTELFNLN